MSLRIAFDLDGVLADMDSALVRQAEAIFGSAVTSQPKQAAGASGSQPEAHEEVRPGGDAMGAADSGPEGAQDEAESTLPLAKMNLTSRQERRLWRHIRSLENFWESLAEIEPGVIARVAAMSAERRWEIIFLTKRPWTAGSTAQVQTQRWLASKGFPLPSVYVVQGSRGRIAAALGLHVVIDDRPENCLDVVVDSKARSILVWRDDERTLPSAARRLGIDVVRSVEDCLKILATLDKRDAKLDPGMLGRVRRMLGLTEAAKA